MGRPRLDVDEDAITTAYDSGASIMSLATEHGVDRTVIRRVLREAEPNVLHFPRRDPHRTPAGYVTSTELLALAHITYRQLDYWTRIGILNATNGNEPGTGNPRLYARTEIPVACLMRDLLEAGLTPRAAHQLARDLAETGHAYVAGLRIDLPQEL